MSSHHAPFHSALKPLPSGFPDKRGPEAEKHLAVSHDLVRFFIRHGYEFCSPPLAEHAESLIPRADMRDLIRFTDPLSRETLALRSDMTAQIARMIETDIARGLSCLPRRLCYMGSCLRAAPETAGGLRERTQVGLERVGGDSFEGLKEAADLALRNLARVSLRRVSFTVGMPELIRKTEALLGLDDEASKRFRRLLSLKDVQGVQALAGGRGAELIDLKWLCGMSATPERLPDVLVPFREAALRLIDVLRAEFPEASFRTDPADLRRFSYHQDLVFSIACAQTRAELARGGHYDVLGVSAVGVTLYAEEVCAAAVWPEEDERRRRVLAACGLAYEKARALALDGYRLFYATSSDSHETPSDEEAKRAGCAFVCGTDGDVRRIDES